MAQVAKCQESLRSRRFNCRAHFAQQASAAAILRILNLEQDAVRIADVQLWRSALVATTPFAKDTDVVLHCTRHRTVRANASALRHVMLAQNRLDAIDIKVVR